MNPFRRRILWAVPALLGLLTLSLNPISATAQCGPGCGEVFGVLNKGISKCYQFSWLQCRILDAVVSPENATQCVNDVDPDAMVEIETVKNLADCYETCSDSPGTRKEQANDYEVPTDFLKNERIANCLELQE